jgi:hypothetical protein
MTYLEGDTIFTSASQRHQIYTAFVGLHKAIFNQKLIDLNGLIEHCKRLIRKDSTSSYRFISEYLNKFL